jgi:hypothetical protein
MLLFKIYGIIEIEEKPEVKIVIVRWRVQRGEIISLKDLENMKKHLPGWDFMLTTEHW